MNEIAYFNLPGLFEHYDFYERFLPLYHDHPEYFYDACRIASIYGAPADCLWGGGRVSYGHKDQNVVFELVNKYEISACLTFSNSLLNQKHLEDEKCNELCVLFENGNNGIIVHCDALLEYLKKKYPGFYFVSSTTKVITNYEVLKKETERNDFKYVVPDFRFNKELSLLESLNVAKLELLVNECCDIDCTSRKLCYESVSKLNLGEKTDFRCRSKFGKYGYRFSMAMKNPAFISIQDIYNVYLKKGISHFKIEGRGLGSAVLLEFILYYMVKPEYHLTVREELYLDNMLDLF